jgi:hypothetical protein
MHTQLEEGPATLLPRRLHHDPFWPPISLHEVREALALSASSSEPRLEVAVRCAILHLDRELAGARRLWKRQGYRHLEQVPSASAGGESAVVRQYHRAVQRATQRLLQEQVTEQPHG